MSLVWNRATRLLPRRKHTDVARASACECFQRPPEESNPIIRLRRPVPGSARSVGVVSSARLERATFGFGGRRSIQLSYEDMRIRRGAPEGIRTLIIRFRRPAPVPVRQRAHERDENRIRTGDGAFAVRCLSSLAIPSRVKEAPPELRPLRRRRSRWAS